MKDLQEISNRLKLLKEQRGLRNQDIADAIGVSQPAVSRWMSGDSVPTSPNMDALASFFGVPFAYIAGFQGDGIEDEETISSALAAVERAQHELGRAIACLSGLVGNKIEPGCTRAGVVSGTWESKRASGSTADDTNAGAQ